MANGFKLTCTASSYSTVGFRCVKGWTTQFAANDPLYLKLKGEPAFKIEPCIVPDPKVEPEITDDDNLPGVESDDLALVTVLGNALIDMLHGAGYTTVGEVILTGQEKLTEISGIGKATAEKIIAACESYLVGTE